LGFTEYELSWCRASFTVPPADFAIFQQLDQGQAVNFALTGNLK